MDSLIVSIAIAVTLGLAACSKDSADKNGDPQPQETSKLDKPGALPRPPSDGKVPADLKPPR